MTRQRVETLRDALGRQLHALSQAKRHVDLPGVCSVLSLPSPTEEEGVSKALRMARSLEEAPESDLPRVASALLSNYPPSTAAARNEIEDILWSAISAPVISKRVRRELARSLDGEQLFSHAGEFQSLLDRLWVLGDDDAVALLLGSVDRSLRAEIRRHVVLNPGDWSPEMLFERLGAFECTDRRFALFVEGLASAAVCLDEDKQRNFAAVVNRALQGAGLSLRESGEEDGYPTFALVSSASDQHERPKNLIFASRSKPDLRFVDAVSNTIEIVGAKDEVLVYDRSIGSDGLRWRELQKWWADARGVENDDGAKRSLYRRLLEILPEESPPQRFLFRSFFKQYAAQFHDLPALLPEVWLHWDPKTARERGPQALARFRMDFLLLLPGSTRVVLEVDGQGHYATPDGRASSQRYAAMAAADRSLRLSGYEVYRFGAAELDGDEGLAMMRSFFDELFEKHNVRRSG